MSDFIPSADEDFNTFWGPLAAAAADPVNPYKLPPETVAMMAAADAAWSPAWTAYKAQKPAFDAALQAKNDGRGLADTAARATNQSMQANPAITAETKASLSLPVHKETRTPVGAIATRPMMQKLQIDHLQHHLWFVDEATPLQRRKPEGAAFCELRETIVPAGGTAPTDPDAMQFLANDTKSPYDNSFDASEVGSHAYYAMRWSNTRGLPGPWSEITGHPIT